MHKRLSAIWTKRAMLPVFTLQFSYDIKLLIHGSHSTHCQISFANAECMLLNCRLDAGLFTGEFAGCFRDACMHDKAKHDAFLLKSSTDLACR